ncbi:hypothetical protein [Yinghuangia sp. YIM S10712]|uniref:hypothetical protein n=1 Tax=Yinghuangia sp. YIM S10712 TaxID=3436930 RepID=UPI003F535E61
MHLSADRSNATMVSIPRDNMVERPTCKYDDGEKVHPASTQKVQFNSTLAAPPGARKPPRGQAHSNSSSAPASPTSRCPMRRLPVPQRTVRHRSPAPHTLTARCSSAAVRRPQAEHRRQRCVYPHEFKEADDVADGDRRRSCAAAVHTRRWGADVAGFVDHDGEFADVGFHRLKRGSARA